MTNIVTSIKKVSLIRILLIVFLVVTVVMPVIMMLLNIDSASFHKIFSSASVKKAAINSVLVTLTATAISVSLALIAAFLLERSTIKYKFIFVILLTVPMLIPSISHGLGITNLFGRNGFIDKLFGIVVDARGFWGIVLGSILYSFPVAFLMIYDTLKYENKSVYEAASTLGIGGFRSFFGITLPFLKKVLITTFFAVFTMIFTDYGVPLAVGGKYPTLAKYLYQEVISLQNFSTGAVIGLILIFPALVAFVVDLIIKDNHVDELKSSRTKRKTGFDICTIAVLTLILIVITIPIASFAFTSFVKSFPQDLNLTFDNYKYLFERLSENFSLSITMSLFAGVVGTILSYLAAYYTVRVKGIMGRVLHFISMLSLAIPGIVLGLGYIFFFKKSFIYNTIIILILVNSAHFFSSPYLLAKNAMTKLNPNFETVGSTLGIKRVSIFFKVIIPNTVGTILEMFSYFFVNSMVTISAVAFLAAQYKPISIMITQFENQLQFEYAAALSLIILVVNIFVKGLILVIKKIARIQKKRFLHKKAIVFDD